MPLPSLVEREPLARHLLFVTTPALWPVWPCLPLVRRTEGREELGLRFDARGACGLCGHTATVFLCNLYALPADFESVKEASRREHKQHVLTPQT